MHQLYNFLIFFFGVEMVFFVQHFAFLFQVEHMLNDRLLQFVNLDLHDVKVLNDANSL